MVIDPCDYSVVDNCFATGVGPRGWKFSNILGPFGWVWTLTDATVSHCTQWGILPEFARRAEINLEVGEKGSLDDFVEQRVNDIQISLLELAEGTAAFRDGLSFESHVG